MNGVVRIDFIYDKDKKKLFVGEANTIPGSLGYYFFNEKNFVADLIEGSQAFWAGVKTEEPEGYRIFK